MKTLLAIPIALFLALAAGCGSTAEPPGSNESGERTPVVEEGQTKTEAAGNSCATKYHCVAQPKSAYYATMALCEQYTHCAGGCDEYNCCDNAWHQQICVPY